MLGGSGRSGPIAVSVLLLPCVGNQPERVWEAMATLDLKTVKVCVVSSSVASVETPVPCSTVAREIIPGPIVARLAQFILGLDFWFTIHI